MELLTCSAASTVAHDLVAIVDELLSLLGRDPALSELLGGSIGPEQLVDPLPAPCVPAASRCLRRFSHAEQATPCLGRDFVLGSPNGLRPGAWVCLGSSWRAPANAPEPKFCVHPLDMEITLRYKMPT